MKMKKLLSVILAAVMLLGCMSIPAFAADPQVLTGFAGGDGSAENPYQIATVEQLANLATIVNGGNGCADTYFVLTADIGTETEPVTSIIGTDYSIPFKGNFDGQNHTVTLNITSDVPYFGLFGYCTSATIANVTTAGSIDPYGDSIFSGGVCGCNNNGTIINCHNSASVSGDIDAGGICGRNYQGTILNCSNSGSVSGMISAGGVCGINEFDAESTSESTIVNCFNSGAVTGDWTAGGICGNTSFLCTVKNCYNSGEVTANTNCGGAFGAVGGSTIINVFYDSDVCANDDSADATGLTTEQCKGKPGTENALVDKLNGYKENDSYPEGWLNWVIDSTTGYPTIVVRSTFLTSFTLNKDYNDKYTADTKSTKVNETVTFTITPITENAPAFTNSTFTITVTDGVGSADVDLPATDDIDSVGDYWYKIEETAGTTAGVTYNDTTYYLHLIVSYKNGEFGFSSAVVRSSSDVTATDGEYPTTGKIDTVSNTYGEGSLTVAQETTVNGEDSSEDTFEATVTFTLPEGTELCGDITYGDNQKVTFDENGVGTVVIELKGGDTVLFENIPDGVTYTVTQTESNEDKGYTLDSVEFDNEDEDGDSVTDLVASGTIGDTADTVTITNSKTVPIDVGVILENGAFIILALGAIAAGAWLIISKRRKSVDAE